MRGVTELELHGQSPNASPPSRRWYFGRRSANSDRICAVCAEDGCLVAALPTLGPTRLLGVGLGNLFGGVPLPFRMSGLAVGLWLVVVVLDAVLATDAAATHASRLTVREALAYL
jgi:hypothetical protein